MEFLSLPSKFLGETPNHPWFYFSCEKSKHGFIYDSYLNKWYNNSIPSLPNSEFLYLHASAGGLVCFQDTESRQVYVCNPVTGSFKELQQPPPSSDDYEVIVVAMALNGNFTSSGYKILSVNFGNDFEVYDSVQNSWFQLKDTPMFIKDFFSGESLPLYMAIESTVYFILDHRSDRIVSCDLATGVWQHLAIQPLPYPKQSVALAEWRGKIMLVGIVGEDNNKTPCVCVWELQKMTLSWKEVDRMSMELYGGDFLINCFVNQGSCLLSLRSQKGFEFISYDMETRAWRFVPMPLKRKTLNLWRWIFNPFVEMKYGGAFYPSLTASP